MRVLFRKIAQFSHLRPMVAKLGDHVVEVTMNL
jgi:hypothetical protein